MFPARFGRHSAGGTALGGTVASNVRPRNPAGARDSRYGPYRDLFFFLVRREGRGLLAGEALARSSRSEPSR